MIYLICALVAVIAYLLGSISGAILISKGVSGKDIRDFGSKNAGSTNMLRVYGKKYAVITLLIDVFKGVLAVLIGILVDWALSSHIDNFSGISLFEQNYVLGSCKYIAAVFAVLGHDYPLYFKFKGGKGVATSLGAIMALDWKAGLIVLVASLLIMVVTKYVSLGSVIGAIIYPCIIVAFMVAKGEFVPVYFIAAIVMGLLIIIKHHTNIVRLKNGTENKLFSKKKKTEENKK